jgi:hypothetical protein
MPLYLLLVIFGFSFFAVVLFWGSVWSNRGPATRTKGARPPESASNGE